MMNKQQKQSEDPLRQFINPEMIERAPEGFTSEVLTRIQTEAVPMRLAARLRNKNLIPVISVSVTIILIVAALLIPGSETGSSLLPVANFIKNIKISLPEINLTSIFSYNLPALMMYVFIGILMLSVFDRALKVLFHRGN
jgi:hypothetical protein